MPRQAMSLRAAALPVAALVACGMGFGQEQAGPLAIVGGRLVVEFDCADGLGVSAIRDAEGRAIARHPTPRRIFEVVLAGEPQQRIASTAMEVTSVRGTGRDGEARMIHRGSGLGARLTWQQSRGDELALRLALRGSETSRLHLAWPILEGLLAEEDPEQVWYFHPRSSGIYNNRPADIASTYGQYVRMQTMGCFLPDGAGLCVINEDPGLRRRSFELAKHAPGHEPAVLHDDYGFDYWGRLPSTPGVGIAIQTRDLEIRPGEELRLPPVAIGLTTDGVQEALGRYREWAGSWYEVERTDWFREAFNYRAARIFDDATPEDVVDAYEDDAIDLLHYMVQAKHLNGAYEVREDWGAAGVRALIDALHERGIRSSHYVEGYIAHETTAIYLEHGDEWGQKRNGENVVAFANMAMCHAAEGWHRWLAQVTTGLVAEMSFDVIYLDELGFGTVDKYVCDNPNHEHPPKWEGMRSTQALLDHVRSALREANPGTPLVTEGPAVDRLFTVLDGVQDYGCRDAYHYPQWYSTPVHWLRFVYPDFKFFDIPAGVASEQAWQIRRVLFNGCGLCTSGRGPSATRGLERRATLLWRDHRDALSSEEVTPLLPTKHHAVYANRFGAGEKTIITVCNANEFPVAGELVALPVSADEHLVDVWQHREPPTRSAHGVEQVALQLGPRDVTVLARMPRVIEARQYGLLFDVRAPGRRIALRRVGADGLAVPWRDAHGEIAFDLLEASDEGRKRAVALATVDDVAADEVVLPPVGEVDVADFAAIASSDNGGAISSGTVRWDLTHDEEHPGWLELSWSQPQPINACHYRFSRGEYTPQDWSLEYRDADGAWATLADKTDGADDHFDAIRTTALRIVVRSGGRWANRCSLVDWQVRWVPPEAQEGAL